ncbi:hypothetical protein Sste5344_007874 [Sporothrix stenoceras]
MLLEWHEYKLPDDYVPIWHISYEAMEDIMIATEAVLGYKPVIRYLSLPHYAGTYWGIFNHIMHRVYDCFQWERDFCEIIYEIIVHREAAQHAYQLPWKDMNISETGFGWGSGTELEDEDTFFLLANLEADYFELSRVCILHVCEDSLSFSRPHMISIDLGEDTLWPEVSHDDAAAFVDINMPKAWDPSVDWHFGQAVQKMGDAISAFMARAPTAPGRDLLRGIIVTGRASEQAMTALEIALRNTLPKVNDTRFYDTIQPSAVFSFGAAIVGRNAQLTDEFSGCSCSSDEAHRIERGYPLDDEFPCNREQARID